MGFVEEDTFEKSKQRFGRQRLTRISPRQKHLIIDFVAKNPFMQRPTSSNASSISFKRNKIYWEQLTENLNAVHGCTKKTWNQWKKTWTDMKIHARMKKLAVESGSSATPLTALDKQVIALICREGTSTVVQSFDCLADPPVPSQPSQDPLSTNHVSENIIIDIVDTDCKEEEEVMQNEEVAEEYEVAAPSDSEAPLLLNVLRHVAESERSAQKEKVARESDNNDNISVKYLKTNEVFCEKRISLAERKLALLERAAAQRDRKIAIMEETLLVQKEMLNQLKVLTGETQKYARNFKNR